MIKGACDFCEKILNLLPLIMHAASADSCANFGAIKQILLQCLIMAYMMKEKLHIKISMLL